MSDSAWENRKVILLNFKEVLQMLKLEPMSEKSMEIVHFYEVFNPDQNR